MPVHDDYTNIAVGYVDVSTGTLQRGSSTTTLYVIAKDDCRHEKGGTYSKRGGR